MRALEFEADVDKGTVKLPSEVAKKVAQGQHVRVIVLVDEFDPSQDDGRVTANPLKALLGSGLVGCAEADPGLSRQYKSELTKSLEEKHGYR
jgi:hypothetical protein